MADSRHFEKTVKSLYLCNRLTDFDEIWHDDAYWHPIAERPLKFRIFENSRWRQRHLENHTKIAISPQRFDRSLRQLVRWRKMGLLTLRPLKISNFNNPRWQMAASLKTVKSPYLCNHLTDFHEIWHDDAYLPDTADRPQKFQIFENSRWRQSPSGKSQKNRNISTTVWPIFTKFGTLMQIGSLNRPDR